MNTETDRKEDKAMTTANDARKAHKILDDLFKRKPVLDEEREFLRSALPELPKQKTLEELYLEVYGVWIGTHGNEWPDHVYGDLETWLQEQHTQLKGLALAKPAHPEFLETEADYQKAPEGTIVALDGSSTIWLKKFGAWRNTAGDHGVESACIALDSRRVLRWGWGNE